MRYSANKADVEGYNNYINLLKDVDDDENVYVYLDRVQLGNVIRCDTEEGWAILPLYNEDGSLCIANDEVVTETFYGNVEVRIEQYKPILH